MFLDLQLLLLFPYGFCPGDDIFCVFVSEGAGDGVVLPVAKGSLHFVLRSALLQLPPPQHHGICALCVAVVIFPRTTRFLLALKNPSIEEQWIVRVTRWMDTEGGMIGSDLSRSPQSLCLSDLPVFA